jgi:tetratricopeptide (TPR) repeat protein
VHVLFATLANKKNHIDAAREVERALSEAPQSAEAHYWAGFLRTMHGRERKDDDKDATRDDDKDADQGEAEKELAAAIALSPQEPRYRLALAFAHFEQQMKKQPRDRDLAALSEEVELVSHYDTSVSAQNFTAWFYAKLGDAPRGMPFAVRALDLNPACWECIDTLARLTFLEGKNVDAVALERRAIAAVPDGQAPKGLLAALARYEAAVATAP